VKKYLVVYDITDDKVRLKVSSILKDSGGTRIQYSAFILEVDEDILNEILLRIRRIIGSEKGKVVAIPLCKRDYERMITILHNYYLPREDEVVI